MFLRSVYTQATASNIEWDYVQNYENSPTQFLWLNTFDDYQYLKIMPRWLNQMKSGLNTATG